MIDVREAVEYAGGHVSGASLLPLSQLAQRAGEVPTDQPVLVLCHLGARSLRAAEYLRGLGVDARSVAGGTDAWQRSGRPLQIS